MSLSCSELVILVPVLHCIKCGSRLDIYKSGGIWTVRCTGCRTEISVDGRKDLFDAYEEYIATAKRGIDSSRVDTKRSTRPHQSQQAVTQPISKETRRGTGPPQRVQPIEDVAQIVSRGGGDMETLPHPIRQMIEPGLDYLVSYRHIPPSEAEYGCSLDEINLPPALRDLLHSKGIEYLYRYQEEAYSAITRGMNVVIAAPTAQGKTEAFILPIVSMLLQSIHDSIGRPGVRVLLVYPTKALAKDQYDKVRDICQVCGLTAEIFDGDTPSNVRNKIYSDPPDILLTNPDILHYHLGWHKSQLVPLLRTVKYVVLDEIHLYCGSIGTNVYYILKRLQLECGRFQKIGASATVANPKEFAELLFDEPVELVESKTARRGAIHFLMFYPGNRKSYGMVADIVGALHSAGLKTLVFGNTHSEAELLNLIMKSRGMSCDIHRAGLAQSYRARVEQMFKAGSLRAIVSTPTLELGIDIGDLDSVVSMIVPITRLTQRIGRAGRKGQESIAVLALRGADPISSFYRANPDKYFTDIAAAYTEPNNEVVAYYQLIAAAMTGRLYTSMFPKQGSTFDRMVRDGIVEISEDGRVVITDSKKAMRTWHSYNIRGIGDTVEIFSGTKRLGERTMPMAAQELHPGAIYLHGGTAYLSIEFKYVEGLGRADVVRIDNTSEHTRSLYYILPHIIETHERRRVFGIDILYCTLEVTQIVDGYVKIDTRSEKVISRHELPTQLEYRFITRGFVFKAPAPSESINEYLKGYLGDDDTVMDPPELYGGAFHALEHVLIESSNMLTGGGTREIGGVSMGDSGIIFVYDGSPGGNGASRLLFSRLEEAFRRSESILSKCECKRVDGCPMCTYSYQCGNNNRPLFKMGALESVRQILSGAESSVDTTEYKAYQPIV